MYSILDCIINSYEYQMTPVLMNLKVMFTEQNAFLKFRLSLSEFFSATKIFEAYV